MTGLMTLHGGEILEKIEGQAGALGSLAKKRVFPLKSCRWIRRQQVKEPLSMVASNVLI